MNTDDHGKCNHCGFNFNGERIYDVGLKRYGTTQKAINYAKAYGAKEGFGRFGKQIYVKPYDENGNKLTPYYKCPKCEGRQ